VAPVTLATLKSLHLAHLRGGARGVALAVRDVAAELGTSTDAVVRGVRVAVASSSPEVSGWAHSVLPYVDGAIAVGELNPSIR
jgi:hypothetical protein